jgi:hypothetical protein
MLLTRKIFQRTNADNSNVLHCGDGLWISRGHYYSVQNKLMILIASPVKSSLSALA